MSGDPFVQSPAKLAARMARWRKEAFGKDAEPEAPGNEQPAGVQAEGNGNGQEHEAEESTGPAAIPSTPSDDLPAKAVEPAPAKEARPHAPPIDSPATSAAEPEPRNGTQSGRVSTAIALHPPQALAVSIEEAAALLSVHVNTVRRQILDGRLKGVRIGRAWRVRVAEIDAFLKRNEVQGLGTGEGEEP